MELSEHCRFSSNERRLPEARFLIQSKLESATLTGYHVNPRAEPEIRRRKNSYQLDQILFDRAG
jgi:hypothetical protein